MEKELISMNRTTKKLDEDHCSLNKHRLREIRQQANQGNAEAQYGLAVSYERGEGIKKIKLKPLSGTCCQQRRGISRHNITLH